ncbi:glycosyltransferase [Alphaproteobacteria bacterium]|nr:glycosyltransferase [Alphaproteobacteria bacterium]
MKYDYIILNYYKTSNSPITGGQRRTNALLKYLAAKGNKITCIYVGTNNTKIPSTFLRNHIEELNVRATSYDYEIFKEIKTKYNEKVGIDTTLIWSAHKNDELIDIIKRRAHNSTSIISQHFSFGYLLSQLKQKKILFSHNIENRIKQELWKNRHLVQLFRQKEYQFIEYFDSVLVCSKTEKQILEKNQSKSKNIKIVPNGSHFYEFPINRSEKEKDKCIYIGSNWHFNVDGLHRLIELCPKFFENAEVNIVGSICERLKKQSNFFKSTIHLHGVCSDSNIIEIANKCSFAINPVISGSGSNVKNADYIALGLPILTTEFGMRGFEDFRDIFHILPLEEWDNFVSSETKIVLNEKIREQVSWERSFKDSF